MRPIVLLAAVSLALATTSASGAVYRWVDGDGTVHYTDQPRPGAEPVNVKTLRPVSDDRSSEPAPAAASRAQRVAAIRAEECRKARARLKDYRDAATLTRTGEAGKPQPLTPEERVQAIARAQEDVAGLCGEGDR